jgi:hypothetical protein
MIEIKQIRGPNCRRSEPDPVPLAGSGTSLYHTWAQGLPDAAVDGGALGIDEADFEDRYHRQRDRLASLARGVQSIAARIPDGMRSGVLAEWGRSILRLRDALALAENPNVRVLRVLDICAHLVCNRLGASAVEECYLRYLANRAIVVLAGERVLIGDELDRASTLILRPRQAGQADPRCGTARRNEEQRLLPTRSHRVKAPHSQLPALEWSGPLSYE